ncbi:MAG: hypothetical protein ONB16_03395 [candidate division KSB1 bacterium]|nr:hypothetical protein [candidate division KSB1 bacterium]MDZ7318002.1 hypothetical protein [candidate division KSB1 bacterium]MDZ7341571.1 hypothetical protein [candidate division KSB1 bacterium]
MTISYTQPLTSAWRRMTVALFKPFDLVKWMVLGFTAFLAGLTKSSGNLGGRGFSRNLGYKLKDFGELLALPILIWDWLQVHSGWFALIIFGILLLIALGVVLLWLSARGRFMFLDNVVHDRAVVKQPWHEFKREGDSLFAWELVFLLIVLLMVILFMVQAYYSARNIYFEAKFPPQLLLPIIGLVILGLLSGLLFAYISVFLHNFVVPIMYRDRITATQAWRRFLSLFANRWGHFLLYGLFWFGLHIVAIMAIALAGLLTCCIGFLLLIIPYIGSVITLPISYTFTALGPEFLAQFGSEYDIFHRHEPATVASENSPSMENS